MSDEADGAGVVERSVQRLDAITTAREGGIPPAPSTIADELDAASVVRDVLAVVIDEPSERELWERVGQTLRTREPETYRLLRGIGLSIAALLDAPVAS